MAPVRLLVQLRGSSSETIPEDRVRVEADATSGITQLLWRQVQFNNAPRPIQVRFGGRAGLNNAAPEPHVQFVPGVGADFQRA